MRTTIDIDDLVLKDLKRLQRREGKSLGRLVSDLLAQVLGESRARGSIAPKFHWLSRPMHARVGLTDKGALFDARDEPRR